MIQKILKFIVLTFILICVVIFLYLNQFFGKKLNENDIKKYTFINTDSTLKIRYFGTMCYYIEYNNQAILTDPFFSNPNPLKLIFGCKPQEKYLSLFSTNELEKINTILIGHGHYDHCLELPIFLKQKNKVNIVGNQSTINLFQNTFPKNTYINSEKFLENNQFIFNQDSSIRIYCIATQHSPHFGKTVLMDGENQPEKYIPNCLLKWQCGKSSISYIIDFMQKDSVEKRVFISGGQTNFPANDFETNLANAKNSDLSILIHWNRKFLDDKLVETKIFKPKNIILGHWNNFFNTKKGDNQYIRKSELPETLVEYNTKYPQYNISILLPETLK